MQIPSIVGLTKQFVHSFTPQLISGGSYGPYQKIKKGTDLFFWFVPS
jgi:hypothetical protein